MDLFSDRGYGSNDCVCHVFAASAPIVVLKFSSLLKLNLDQTHRTAVATALDNALGLGLHLAQEAGDARLSNINIRSAALAAMVGYVKQTVPAAVTHFGLTDDCHRTEGVGPAGCRAASLHHVIDARRGRRRTVAAVPQPHPLRRRARSPPQHDRAETLLLTKVDGATPRHFQPGKQRAGDGRAPGQRFYRHHLRQEPLQFRPVRRLAHHRCPAAAARPARSTTPSGAGCTDAWPPDAAMPRYARATAPADPAAGRSDPSPSGPRAPHARRHQVPKLWLRAQPLRGAAHALKFGQPPRKRFGQLLGIPASSTPAGNSRRDFSQASQAAITSQSAASSSRIRRALSMIARYWSTRDKMEISSQIELLAAREVEQQIQRTLETLQPQHQAVALGPLSVCVSDTLPRKVEDETHRPGHHPVQHSVPTGSNCQPSWRAAVGTMKINSMTMAMPARSIRAHCWASGNGSSPTMMRPPSNGGMGSRLNRPSTTLARMKSLMKPCLAGAMACGDM